MTEELCVSIIMDIINGEQNEFAMGTDPLKNGGLDSYGKEEFLNRVKSKMEQQ